MGGMMNFLWSVCDLQFVIHVPQLTRDLIPCLWCAAAKPLLWVYIGVAAAAVFVLLIIVCIVCRCVAKRRSKPGKQRPRNEQTISGSQILKTWCQVTASACCAINFYNSSEPKKHRATMGISSFERISYHRFSSALRVQYNTLQETFRRILKWEYVT